MENRLGHNSTIRSLVRPVSPLSRWAKLPIPINENDDNHKNIGSEDEKDRENRNANEKKQYSTLYTNNTNRSRSPILPSTVHLPNHEKDYENFDQNDQNKNSTEIILAKETRRIIVHDSLKSNTDISDKQTRLKHKSSHHQHDHSYHKSSDFYKKPRLMNSLHPSLALNLSSPINRDTTCPIFLRMFYSVNARHYSLDSYAKGKLPENEIQMNTWIDATLKELAEEIRHVCRLARRRGTRLHFAIVYPDSHGTYGRRQLGVVITGFGNQNTDLLHNNENNNNNVGLDNNVETENKKQKPFNLMDDSSVTLLSKRFQIGDYIDCAIVEYVPGSLVGWSSGRRPLGPKPSSPHNSKREEIPKI